MLPGCPLETNGDLVFARDACGDCVRHIEELAGFIILK